MTLKLLILGLPGSGKSSMARYIATYLEDKDWGSTRFSDHVILQNMFHADTEGKQFKPSEYGGFDVTDIEAFDIALKKLELIVKIHLLYAKQDEIVLIEFARNDYLRAFRQLSETFLQDAYFLHLDVDLEICKKRIRERITHPSTQDDFYVSEYIFNSYYNEDDGRNIPQILANDHSVEIERVKVIDNNGSLSDSIAQVYQFVDAMCGSDHLWDL